MAFGWYYHLVGLCTYIEKVFVTINNVMNSNGDNVQYSLQFYNQNQAAPGKKKHNYRLPQVNSTYYNCLLDRRLFL